MTQGSADKEERHQPERKGKSSCFEGGEKMQKSAQLSLMA